MECVVHHDQAIPRSFKDMRLGLLQKQVLLYKFELTTTKSLNQHVLAAKLRSAHLEIARPGTQVSSTIKQQDCGSKTDDIKTI